MTTEVIVCIISCACSIACALISAISASRVSKAEQRILQIRWQREDSQNFDGDFIRACNCVCNYLDSGSDNHRRIADRQLQVLSASAPATLLLPLHRLRDALAADNRSDAASALEELINAKRSRR